MKEDRDKRSVQKSGWFLLPLLMAMVLLCPWNHAQASVSASAGASVNVQPPLSIVGVTPLEFGQVRPGDSAGTVVVTTANTRFATGGTGIAASSQIWNRGVFNVTGASNQVYSISLQSSTALHDQGGQNPDLFVTDLIALSVTKGVEGPDGLINPAGTDVIYIGGTLQVPSKAVAKNGKYEGTVTVTINY